MDIPPRDFAHGHLPHSMTNIFLRSPAAPTFPFHNHTPPLAGLAGVTRSFRGSAVGAFNLVSRWSRHRQAQAYGSDVIKTEVPPRYGYRKGSSWQRQLFPFAKPRTSAQTNAALPLFL